MIIGIRLQPNQKHLQKSMVNSPPGIGDTAGLLCIKGKWMELGSPDTFQELRDHRSTSQIFLL